MRATFNSFRHVWLFFVVVLAMAWGMSKSPQLSVKEVDVLEAHSLVEMGAIVIDVRPTDKFEGRHIPNALSIPLDQLPNAITDTLAEAKSQRLLIYCGDGSSLGPEGTATLNEAGYVNAVNLKGGISGWADAGYPVQSGS